MGKGAEGYGVLRVASIFFHLFGIKFQVKVIEQSINPERETQSELLVNCVEVRDLVFGGPL